MKFIQEKLWTGKTSIRLHSRMTKCRANTKLRVLKLSIYQAILAPSISSTLHMHIVAPEVLTGANRVSKKQQCSAYLYPDKVHTSPDRAFPFDTFSSSSVVAVWDSDDTFPSSSMVAL